MKIIHPKSGFENLTIEGNFGDYVSVIAGPVRHDIEKPVHFKDDW